MIFEIEDELHGDEWRSYVTVRAFDDNETLIFEGHVAPGIAEELGDAYLDAVTNPDVLRMLAELLEDDEPPGPGGSVL